MSSEKAQPGDTVELKQPDGGFYDHETNFQIRNDEQAQLGETIGKRTNEALMSGGLVIVSSGKAKKATGQQSKTKDESDLPDDLPGRKEFLAAGLNFEQVKNLKSDEELLAVKGIGAQTIDAMKKWADKNA